MVKNNYITVVDITMLRKNNKWIYKTFTLKIKNQSVVLGKYKTIDLQRCKSVDLFKEFLR
jgi:hypothetical protein